MWHDTVGAGAQARYNMAGAHATTLYTLYTLHTLLVTIMTINNENEHRVHFSSSVTLGKIEGGRPVHGSNTPQ
jgi:hypothetical protein